MSYDAYYQGNVPLKEGVTFTQIMKLYVEQTGDAFVDLELEDVLDLEVEGTWSNDHGVELTVKGGELEYYVDANVSGSWDFESFLLEVADLAEKGWVSYEGEEREAAFYGPTKKSVLEAELEHATQERDWAQEKIDRLQKELIKHA